MSGPTASVANSTAGGDNSKSAKRSFEFRMSKKVAELTQVVHMLFTRNHEKEVEIEALKEAYEYELAEVVLDARRRIADLQRQLEDSLRQQSTDTDRIRKLLEGEFLSKEQELKAKLEDTDRQLQEERTECQKLRDILIRAERDNDNLRQNVSQQQSSLQDELTRRDREIERLKKLVLQLEQSLRECGKDSSELIKELGRSNEALERELRQVHSALDESHRTRDQLMLRNKQLEGDMKNLRSNFNRKVSEATSSSRLSRNGSVVPQEQNEELDKLRREIQRYRLELSNREGNFNRMFSEKQPILVDRTAPSGGASGLKLLTTSHAAAGSIHQTMNGGNHMNLLKRERTMPTMPPSGPVICFDENATPYDSRERSLSTPMDGRDSRFPSICSTPDFKARPARNSANQSLSKPRPLPKEMLSSK